MARNWIRANELFAISRPAHPQGGQPFRLTKWDKGEWTLSTKLGGYSFEY